MSNRAYVCAECGALRRRPAAYFARDGSLPDDYPQCCGEAMTSLAKGYAEAATKLDAAERVRWLAAGGHIMRKSGNRWVAAFSDREIEIARAQLARYRPDDAPAT